MRGVCGEMPEKGAELFRVILMKNDRTKDDASGCFVVVSMGLHDAFNESFIDLSECPAFCGVFYFFYGLAGSKKNKKQKVKNIDFQKMVCYNQVIGDA